MRTGSKRSVVFTAAPFTLTCLLLVTACSSGTGRLPDYVFDGAEFAVAASGTQTPEFESPTLGPAGIDDRRDTDGTITMRVDPATARVLDIFGEVINEIDPPERTGTRVGSAAEGILNAREVDFDADPDFMLSVRLERYGIWPTSSRVSLLQYEMEGYVRLTDRRDGSVIWESTVVHREPFQGIENRSTANVRLMGREILNQIEADDLRAGMIRTTDEFADKLIAELRAAMEAAGGN